MDLPLTEIEKTIGEISVGQAGGQEFCVGDFEMLHTLLYLYDLESRS